MITLLADENIAGLDDYFALHTNINLIKATGRKIPDIISTIKPDALFVRSITPINDSLSFLPKFIATATLGTDHIDFKFIKNNGIEFVSAQGSSKHTVAQYVITAILAIRPITLTRPARLGIVGLGNIGGTLAQYANRLGWQVLGYDPYLPPSDLNNSSFNELLAADIISIHTPLTFDGNHPTHQLINQQVFEKLASDTLLINAARGKIIDEHALIAWTKQGGQAVLDVFCDEPTPKKSLIDSLCLATPHIAGYSLDGKLKGTDMVYRSFCQAFTLPVLSQIGDFLPPNPYHFDELIYQLKQGNFDKLAEFYNIKADDNAFRGVITGETVSAQAFDLLRKNYPLKREWAFN